MRQYILFSFFVLNTAGGLIASNPNDSSSSAPAGAEDVLIHYRKGVIDHTFTWEMSKATYDVKLEFLSQKGIDDFGTLELTYNPADENISGIKGKILLPDGTKADISKKDIHKKKVSGEWGDKEIEIRVIFPKLEVGSIVEYTYYKSYTGSNKTIYWPFQNEYYTKYSEVKFIPWPYQKWGYNIINMLETPEVEQIKNRMQKAIKLIRRDIPALKKEKYSLPYDCLREGISFYYFDADFVYDDFWPECGQYIYKTYVKKYMKPCKDSKKIIAEHFTDYSGDLVEGIYDYVCDHYFPLDVLSKKEKANIDERYIKKLEKADSISDLFDFQYVGRLHVNYILASLLATALPQAKIELAFYVPWDKSMFNPNMKTFYQFTAQMLRVTSGGQTYWLAPSKRFLAPNRLPWTAKGTEIIVVGKNGCTTEQIPLDTWDKNVTSIEAQVHLGDDDAIMIQRCRTLGPHASYVMRKSLLFFDEAEIKDLLEEDIQDDFGSDAQLTDYRIEKLEDVAAPLVIHEHFSYPYEPEEVGDKILFQFPGLIRHKTNPFQAEKRISNIIFPYAYRINQTITYELPEGINLISLPDNQSINDTLFMYHVEYKKLDDGKFRVKTQETLDANILSSKAHQFFNESYRKILMLDRKTAVLTEEF